MGPTEYEQELALNRQAYEAMRGQIQRDHPGQYIAIAFGKIVAITPDFESAKAAVDRLQPAPNHVLVFPADEEPAFVPFEALHTEWS
jgi:hypothetical protein